MNNYFSSDFTIGILGGGQLGKMLLYETRKYDIRTHVLDPNPQAPCKISCNKFTEGSLMDYDTVYNFGKQVDVLTFSNASNASTLTASISKVKTSTCFPKL